jgi:hypothetical protein
MERLVPNLLLHPVACHPPIAQPPTGSKLAQEESSVVHGCWRYFRALVWRMTEDEIFFELIDELSPGVLKTDDPFLNVVMRIRLS